MLPNEPRGGAPAIRDGNQTKDHEKTTDDNRAELRFCRLNDAQGLDGGNPHGRNNSWSVQVVEIRCGVLSFGLGPPAIGTGRPFRTAL
jgi:hypothetical protein